jgi:DNA-binding NarL/FixJ family response regulator
MSVPSNEASVLIVDARPLRGAGIAALVVRLIGSNACRIVSIASPEDAEELIDGSVTFQMVIYSIGPDSVGDPRHRKGIKTLGRLAAPVVIFSDNDTQKETALALTLGVHGFLHSGMAVELTRQALSFLLRGGSYFPPLRISRSRSSQQNGSVNSLAPNTMPEDALAMASSNDGLTQRQRMVLQGLRRGESNKTIARALGIRASTVKVHVRQLMRKFGVDNRTKLAMAGNTASETGVSEEDPESRPPLRTLTALKQGQPVIG